MVAATIVSFSVVAGSAVRAATMPRTNVLAIHQSLRSVLLGIGKTYDVNVVLLQPYDLPVDVSLRDVSLDEALAAILRTRGIRYVHTVKLVVVGERATERAATAPQTHLDSDIASLTNVSARAALAVLRGALPKLQASVGPTSSLIVLRGSTEDIATAHRLLGAIDVPDPAKAVSTAFLLQHADAGAIASELKHLYPKAQFYVGANRSVLAGGPQATLDQAKALVAALDVAATTSKPAAPTRDVAVVPIVAARASDVARTT